MSIGNVSAVLVHGAWADGSSWSKVIERLKVHGINAVAAPLPLSSLHEDVAALDRTLERIEGPVVLAGHAYAGAVIGSTSAENIKALVYVAALAPDEGETVADVFYRGETHPQAPKLTPDRHGLIWLPDEAFAAAFAQHAATSHCGFVHRRGGWAPSLEGSAELVPDRRAGPDDQRRHATFHGTANECARALIPGRSHANRNGSRRRGQRDRRSGPGNPGSLTLIR